MVLSVPPRRYSVISVMFAAHFQWKQHLINLPACPIPCSGVMCISDDGVLVFRLFGLQSIHRGACQFSRSLNFGGIYKQHLTLRNEFYRCENVLSRLATAVQGGKLLCSGLWFGCTHFVIQTHSKVKDFLDFALVRNHHSASSDGLKWLQLSTFSDLL